MRQIININKNWGFTKESIDTNNVSLFKFQKINLPHTWNKIDGQDGGDDYYRGKGYYKKEFNKPNLINNQRLYIEFKGVNACAEVYLNNKLVTSHKGGYSTFRKDITDYLLDNNILLVIADNSVMDDVYPQKADFTFYGGIYRDVNLIIVENEHFDLDYFGSIGLKVDTKVNGRNASLIAKAYANKGDIKIVVKDNKGYYVVSGNNNTELTINDVRLWNGLKDPYLYNVEALLYVNGEIKDKVSTQVGFRTIKIDKEKGFYLNKKHYPLRGVCRHQDKEGKGNALSKKDHEIDIDFIREIGANCLRLAHYQQDDYIYSLCDKYGILVWSEIPYISAHLDKGDENALSQMKELIVQTYNHPSIFIRGISNEVDMFTHDDPLNMRNLHIELNNMIKKIDSSRYSAIAIYEGTPNNHSCYQIADIIGTNTYMGWYGGELKDNGKKIDNRRESNPNVYHSISEYGADALPYLHSKYPVKQDCSEEYQCLFHESVYKQIEKRPYIFASFVWNMFDFGADNRNVGGDGGKNRKGLVSFDRKIRKDTFYFYKAKWSDEPFIHICGKRFINRTGNYLDIKVYSNQKEISIYQNGKLIETKKAQCIFTFKLPLEKENEIEVRSNKLIDKAYFKKVSKPDPSYQVKTGRISGW